MKRNILILTIIGFALLASQEYVYGQSRNMGRKSGQGKEKSLLDVARAHPQLSTFVQEVIQADIAAANGVIHIINVVMVPPVEEADANN
jgi:uncharacterized surface protein with fasciclin (FAS1) repeats